MSPSGYGVYMHECPSRYVDIRVCTCTPCHATHRSIDAPYSNGPEKKACRTIITDT